MIIIVVCLAVCALPKNVYASNTSNRLREYEEIIEALNNEFGLEMALLDDKQLSEMGIETENAYDNMLQMPLAEFEDELREQCDYILGMKNSHYKVKCVIENGGSVSGRSSGEKTQFCHIYGNGGTYPYGRHLGDLYLKANVVEAGVNQYTSVKEIGGTNTTNVGIYFNVMKSMSSYSFSNNMKTCTVKYKGMYKKANNIALTSYITYTIHYQVNSGNQTLYVDTI